MMTACEIILKKQQGGELSRAELQFLISGMLDRSVPTYQVTAWLMAVFFRGMTSREIWELTQVMLNSGLRMDLSRISRLKADKHSTGGVGDKVTLILAPLVAAGGVPVPMISGRGLGHTGGTLDKLTAIPGFRTDLSPERFVRQVEELGLCIIGQSDDLVPADKLLYSLRDVTATVASVPLITGSIMSKKLAEGIDALVLDVKVGSGAIYRTREEARELARSLLAVGAEGGLKMAALLTQMDQPLGWAVGNWNEVLESLEALRGNWPEDLKDVTLALAALMFQLTGRTADISEGLKLAAGLVADGSALNLFRRFVEAQGGLWEYLEHPERYPQPRHRLVLEASEAGWISGLDARELGLTAVTLGAGRRTVDDEIDPSAGITLRVKVGDRVEKGQVLGEVCFNRDLDQREILQRILGSVRTAREAVPALPSILELLDHQGTRNWSDVLNGAS